MRNDVAIVLAFILSIIVGVGCFYILKQVLMMEVNAMFYMPVVIISILVGLSFLLFKRLFLKM